MHSYLGFWVPEKTLSPDVITMNSLLDTLWHEKRLLQTDIGALTPFKQIEFSIKLHTIKSGWSIVYIEASQVENFKNIAFLSLKIDFVSANSAEPDEMQHYAAFHLGLHC